ncbi:MAG: hypothetical protein QXM03_12660 [Metallosphaera sp.]|uniref:hypothetical protein n=1 Tax=Metallosphaera sp. TaxID=2020860 RepID=UPI003160F239
MTVADDVYDLIDELAQYMMEQPALISVVADLLAGYLLLTHRNECDLILDTIKKIETYPNQKVQELVRKITEGCTNDSV